jgi:RHS repeat-associated protein
LLIRTDAKGNNTYYVYGLGLIGEQEADGTYKAYHFDNRGSTTALTDLQGNVTDTFAYAPFGELIQRTGTTDTPFMYNGRDGVMTDSNGLYYMRARYYNPDIKRFINQDVLEGNIKNGQSMNRYAYVNGNPVSKVDPFGLCPESTSSNNSIAHLILGGLSFIPGLNVISSLADSGLYLTEGDYVDAAIAAACAVPFVKEGVLGVDIAKMALEDGSEIVRAANEAEDVGNIAGVSESVEKTTLDMNLQLFAENGADDSISAAKPTSPDFVVTPNGDVIPIPEGATGPVDVSNPAGKTTGFAYTGGNGGSNGQVSNVRIMDPTPPRGNSPGYPNGYVKYENKGLQGVDPITGRTLPNSQSHFPLN